MKMIIQLNGEQQQVPKGLTLAALLEWLKLPLDRIAVERNREVVKKSAWSTTQIEEGDQLEVVQMVGGGSSIRNLP